MTQTMVGPFITAEDSQSPRYGVWVLLVTYSVMIEGVARAYRFEITTSTGYKAALPACLRDFCDKRVNCTRKINSRGMHSGMSVDKWLEHSQTHCHGYHLVRAQQFRDAVLATYEEMSA